MRAQDSSEDLQEEIKGLQDRISATENSFNVLQTQESEKNAPKNDHMQKILFLEKELAVQKE